MKHSLTVLFLSSKRFTDHGNQGVVSRLMKEVKALCEPGTSGAQITGSFAQGYVIVS